MACSKYEYVKQYEEHRVALHSTYIVIRVDVRNVLENREEGSQNFATSITSINPMI